MPFEPLQKTSDPARPLLTIAIPTWNRAPFLQTLLASLLPRAELFQAEVIELLVADNASSDSTPSVVERTIHAGLPIRSFRHAENIGSDANFVFCYEQARGRYFWLCGDDDIILPPEESDAGALLEILAHLQHDEFDLIYVTSYGFQQDWRAERHGDPLGRDFHVLTKAADVTRVVNIMFTFVSGMIVHRERLERLRQTHADIAAPAAFAGSNLVQLSWALPLLRFHRQSLVLWRRLVGCFTEARGGYSFGSVFGEQLVSSLQRLLPDRPELQRIFTNATIRRYLPSGLLGIREHSRDLRMNEAGQTLRRAYGRNWRFWVFAWPVLRLPLPAARLWQRLGAAASKLLYAVEVPGFWQKRLKR